MILLNWKKNKSMYYDEDTDHVIICSDVGKPPCFALNLLFTLFYSFFFIIICISFECISSALGSFLFWVILDFPFVLIGILILPALEEKTAKYNVIRTNETQRIYLPEATLYQVKNIYGNISEGNDGHLILYWYAYRISPIYIESPVLVLGYSIFTKTDVVPAILLSVTCFEIWFLFYHITHKRQRDKLKKRMKRLLFAK